MKISLAEAKELITDCLLSNLVCMLSGSPGIGKSDIVRSIANDYNLQLIDVRMSYYTPEDFNGFPSIDKVHNRAEFVPMNVFPLADDTLPAGKDGWLLFLDEFNSASPAVVAAAYKLLLDRTVGMHPLHQKVRIVCAGNLDTDRAYVNRLNTAMQSRLVHLELEENDHQAWLDWAGANGIDYRVIAYINFRPEHLNAFKPDHNDKTYACQRTWAFASKVLSRYPKTIPESKLPLLAGILSEGIAREFFGFCRNFDELAPIAEIIAHPNDVRLPAEPSACHAMAGCVSNHLTPATSEPLMTFLARLPVEFQVIALQSALRRDRKLTADKFVQQWISKNATRLF